MHVSIKVLKQALSYAKFPTDEIKQATRSFINDLGDNLEECDYEQPPFIDSSAAKLQNILNEYDEDVERSKASGNVDEETGN